VGRGRPRGLPLIIGDNAILDFPAWLVGNLPGIPVNLAAKRGTLILVNQRLIPTLVHALSFPQVTIWPGTSSIWEFKTDCIISYLSRAKNAIPYNFVNTYCD
jgi:hypothetical protein